MTESVQGSQAYEVFAQFGIGKDIQLLGSVRANDALLAWHAAKEAYTRRERCSQLWVVPRDAVVASGPDDQIVLLAGMRMDFRTPAYPGRHRRAREETHGAPQGTAPSEGDR